MTEPGGGNDHDLDRTRIEPRPAHDQWMTIAAVLAVVVVLLAFLGMGLLDEWVGDVFGDGVRSD